MKAAHIIDKLDQVQERRLGTPRDYMFHGTSSMKLRGILKKGLIPNPKEKVWDWGEEQGSRYGPNLASYGGVYLTDDLSTAIESAWRAARKDAGEPIVVIAIVQKRSGLLDEDVLTNQVFRSVFRSLLESVRRSEYGYDQGRLAHHVLSGERDEDIDNMVEGVLGILNDISPDDDVTKSVSRAELREFVVDGLERIASYRDDSELSFEEQEKQQEQAEKNYRKAVDKLTKKLRRLVLSSHTLRITEPINYRGRNKIVAIIGFESFDFHYKYGSGNDLPEELVRTLESHFASI